jgi:predicted O-methyltransferase YrrM
VSRELWNAVDGYIAEHVLEHDAVLERALQASAEGGLPSIAVSAPQGKLLHLLARMQGARRILELGTLGAYSTIWLARALPRGGQMITIEANPAYAQVAAANLEHAGLRDVVELRVGPALEHLQALSGEKAEPFDLIFIDADKEGTPDYFREALRLSRAGSVIITDNVVRGGAVIERDDDDPRVRGMRAFHELLRGERRVSATTIQTVGSKGHDGFNLALVGEGG